MLMNRAPRLSGLQVRLVSSVFSARHIQDQTVLLRSQRQVLSLYRTVIRTARTKGAETDPIIKFARAEFERLELWSEPRFVTRD